MRQTVPQMRLSSPRRREYVEDFMAAKVAKEKTRGTSGKVSTAPKSESQETQKRVMRLRSQRPGPTLMRSQLQSATAASSAQPSSAESPVERPPLSRKRRIVLRERTSRDADADKSGCEIPPPEGL